MEFYFFRLFLLALSREFQFPTGWNSTLINYQKRSKTKVSIPNGMEFYTPLALGSVSFMSVSIPNGMEFYCAGKYRRISDLGVSIPNGMEFYRHIQRS